MEPLFSEPDLCLIESLRYDSSLSPNFDGMKACLVWDDERPDGLSPSGYEVLCDLWIIRGYIHRGVPQVEWGIDPSSGYFQELWERVQAAKPNWPGFNRTELSHADRVYLEENLRDPSGQL